MKIKRKQFIQHLSHEVEDEDKVWEYLDESLPNIGLIVMYFNGLEKLLDQMLCEMFTERTDRTGLIVLQNMQYSSKVNLFGRFSDELHSCFVEVPAHYEGLLNKLREAARLRNIVVHADWENTDNDGYTYTSIKFSENGMEQEYVQLSAESLTIIVDRILDARKQLGEYWDAKSNL